MVYREKYFNTKEENYEKKEDSQEWVFTIKLFIISDITSFPIIKKILHGG